MDGSFYAALARLLPPELLVLVVLGLFAMILYHLRDCKTARRDIYERMTHLDITMNRIDEKLAAMRDKKDE